MVSRKLPGQDVDVFTGEGKTSYAPGDVLFDTIRTDSARALRAIAMQINKSPLSAQLRLSGRRARAAADWLVKNAGFKADLISTKGFGEAAPVVPTTGAAKRQTNRRVVMTVLYRRLALATYPSAHR